MQLFEIQEPPSQPVKPHVVEIAIGIDFGTTNSLVAVSINKKPYVIDDKLLPSIIDDDLSIGKTGIRSIKRLVGKSLDEIKTSKTIPNKIKDSIKEEHGVIKILIGKKYFSIAEAISLILKELKTRAEQHFSTPIVKAILTVPANFDDTMRNLIKFSASLAGLDILRLISEPTAAAYAYGLENKSEGMYLVYDLGGGTFDVSVLNMRMGVFQVLATDGDLSIGGDDIDHELGKYLDNHTIAQTIKEHLSSNDSYNQNGYTITRSQFEKIISPIIESTIHITKSVAKPYLDRLKGIILVGGSTRIPLITKLLSQLSIPIYSNIDPDKVVALGAALQAENLTSIDKNNLIIDVVPLSLGLELMGGIVERIIQRNTSIPTSVTKEFTTYADNQTAMSFNIVQGERELAQNCRSLAKFELKNIPPMKAGAARISVTFEIDADGILNTTAIEKITNTKQMIEVKPTYGITEVDITTMLEDAYTNTKIDHMLKLLIATKTEAQQEILNIRAALQETPKLISKEESSSINQCINMLELSCSQDARDDILEKLQELRNLTHHFIEKRMDFSVSEILKGKKIKID
jgi:molecular chaperone HscA